MARWKGVPVRDPAMLHIPVLRELITSLLAPALDRPGAVLLDATLGMGGHAHALLTAAPQARLIGIDADPEALELAARRLAEFGDRVELHHARFDELERVVATSRFTSASASASTAPDAGPPLDAVLFDLGVSSLQLDSDERGFAYSREAQLDMRMDTTRSLTAAEILATYDEQRLRQIFWRLGGERQAGRIARAIVATRDSEPLTTSTQLVELIRATLPQAAMREGGHPAKRVFQALRIEVNQELEALAVALPRAVDLLALKGRLAVMSYHSGEDTVVKRVLAEGLTSAAPPDLVVEPPDLRAFLAPLVRGAVKADEAEVAANPRAASVRVRAVTRIASTPRRLA